MTTPVLDVSGLTVRFGGLYAVNDVSLALHAGKIHGLIGPNGAGKTTFFNAVTGLVRHSGGRIVFDGSDVGGLPAHRRASRGIRRSFQSVQLVQSLTALENVMVGLHSEYTGWRSALGLFSLSGNDGEAAAKAREVARFLGLGHLLHRPVSELTFAEQRFVEITRAIVSRPKVLMLDEPAAGLSEPEIQALDKLLRRLATEWGMAVLLVEHVLSLVMVVSDEITVLDNGRFVTNGTPQMVADNPAVRAAYLGEETGA
jgi:branched-chain amino acid transport system ATP-binding protein